MTVEMTSDDLLWVAEKVYQIGGLKQPYEAAYAVLGGWDFLEFTSLYTAYMATHVLHKERFSFPFEGRQWVVDHIIDGDLWIAEIELKSPDETFTKPDWVLEEVTGRPEYSSFSPPPSPTEARHGLSGMLAELRRAVIEDEVEADAIYLSLKRALAALRRNSKPERLRTFALGMVHDALLFTSLKQVTQDGLDGLASAVALATKDELSDSCLDQIEDLLQLNGFELVPIK